MAREIAGAHRTMGLIIAGVIFVVDQAIKWIVTYPLQLSQRREIELFPFFQLTWIENRGISMGFLTADTDFKRWMLVGLTAVIASAVLVWLWREKNRQETIALGFVLGGALGNILDRIRLGYVVDYADLHIGEFRPFLIFNVGDAAITIGVLLLLVGALLASAPSSKKEV